MLSWATCNWTFHMKYSMITLVSITFGTIKLSITKPVHDTLRQSGSAAKGTNKMRTYFARSQGCVQNEVPTQFTITIFMILTSSLPLSRSSVIMFRLVRPRCADTWLLSHLSMSSFQGCACGRDRRGEGDKNKCVHHASPCILHIVTPSFLTLSQHHTFTSLAHTVQVVPALPPFQHWTWPPRL